METQTYDAIVVGAGLGGLCAAAQLVLKGVKTLLLEQHNLPGGFASSFVRGRFEFEPSLHEITDVVCGDKIGNVGLFLQELGIKIDWVPVGEAYRLIITNPKTPIDEILPFGVQNFIEAIVKADPGSREAVTKYMALCQEVADAIEYVQESGGNPNKLTMLKKFRNFVKTTSYSVDEVVNSLEPRLSPRSYALIHGYWVYLLPSLDRLSFSHWATMLMKFLIMQGYVPPNRSHELTSAFETKIRELGGDIRYNSKVSKILVENGAITGVETEQGDKYLSKYVISNACPTLAYNNLIYPKTEVPEIALKECNSRTEGVAVLNVYAGLDVSAEDLGLTEYTYFIFSDIDTSECYKQFYKLKEIVSEAAIFYSAANPDGTPKGTSILSITYLYRPEIWAQVKPEDYFRVKTEVGEDLIRVFEEATGVSLKGHIEEFEVATPQTMNRYTGAYKGIVYAYEPETWDSIIPRSLMLDEQRHIKGLEFCGGFTHLCHGYASSMISGIDVSKHVLELMKKGGN
jgi:phytoene dehydrogenase-like protein